jgi:ATP-binding cassette subfamily F protein 3
MLFRLEDVHKSYGAADIVTGATCQVNPGEKIGLVGRNGAGKSTLFKLICNLEQPDAGRIARVNGLSLGLLEQHPHFASDVTVLEAGLGVFSELLAMEEEMQRIEHEMADHAGENDLLNDLLERYSELQHAYEERGGFTYHAKTEEVLLGLGFSKADFRKLAVSLSGGQQGRLHLATLLLRKPDILLLDEPTNHLDLRAVEWLEEFLLNYDSAYVVISHDRFLLDRVTTRTIELDRGKTNSYPGGFTEYIEKRDALRAIQQKHYEQQQEEIARTQDFIRRNLAGQKTKQAKSRRTQLARLDRIEAPTTDAPQGNFSMKPVTRTGEQALVLDDLRVGYDGKAVAGPFHVTVRRGDRLGIVGPNGAGKTTLLKTLLGVIPAVAGDLVWGAGVKTGYYDQRLESLSLNNTIIGELQDGHLHATEYELRSFLAQFLFIGDDVFKQVRMLSGGERGRLALAKLIYSQANVLILDEPTNHLDIPSCEALEAAINAYGGTCIIVSHDRYFLDRVGTRMLYLEPGGSRLFEGSYSELWAARQAERSEEMRRRREAEAAERPSAKGTDAVAAATASAAETKGGAAGKSQKRKKLRAPETVEAEIAATEAALAAVSSEMGLPEVASNPKRLEACQAAYVETSQKLEALYAEWEDVASANGEAAAGAR